MKLDGGARLAATAWVVSRPTVVIRRHRLKVDTLEAWVERDCSARRANLLAAAVKGCLEHRGLRAMSAGKTTLMRALCAEIPREEAIGTFETEYELFLSESGNHEIVIDWESRPGVGEIGADGRAAGAFDSVTHSTTVSGSPLSPDRRRDPRPGVWTMIKAMESGTGSLSTTHAANATACIRKLVTTAMEAGSHVTRDLALEKLVGCLNLIVQLNRRIESCPTAPSGCAAGSARSSWSSRGSGRSATRWSTCSAPACTGRASQRDPAAPADGPDRVRFRPGAVPGRGRRQGVAP
jgi:pilus assembly protein CpaF